MKAPRILIVDDQHEVIRMLRSSLELSGTAYSVIDVPSGEEALIELTRGPIHVLVTDIRLPGMSGFELMQRCKQLHPQARTIVITGQPLEEIQAKAEELGVVALFQKPIGTNFFLEAVESALANFSWDEDSTQSEAESQPHVMDILSRVRHTLSAELTLLIDEHGTIVAQAGDSEIPDLETALVSITTAFNAGQKTSALLGSSLPGSIQFFDGDTHDLYLANVGVSNGLVIILRSGQAATKMGAIVHYGRRAAAAILEALTSVGAPASDRGGADLALALEWKEFKIDETHPGIDDDSQDWTGSKLKADDTEELKKSAMRFWGESADDTSEFEAVDEDILTFREARDRGLVPDEPDTLP